MSSATDDSESSLLYSRMQEDSGLKWSYVRLVYAILVVHLLFFIGVAALISSVHVLSNFFRTTKLGLAVYITIVLVHIIVPFLMRYPWDNLLAAIFNLSLAFAIGGLCAYLGGRVVIEAIIAAILAFISLVAYTTWALKRGQDFSLVAPFLLSVLVIVLTFNISQIFYPMGKVTDAIYSGLSVIVFSTFVLYDTDTMIMRHSSDDSFFVMLYLYKDIFYISMNLLKDQEAPRPVVDDVEGIVLYSMMHQAPELRWRINRVVYTSLVGHFVLTISVAAIISSVHSLSNFFQSTKLGLAIYISIIAVNIIVPFFRRHYKDIYPWNSVMIIIFNLSFSLAIGVLCAYVRGRVVIETIIAAIVVFICLIVYSVLGSLFTLLSTFLAPFIFSLVVIVLTFAISQICSPMGKVTDVIYSGLSVIVFTAYVLYDSDYMILRHHEPDGSVWAMLYLYQDIPHMFIYLLKVLRIIKE